MFCCDMFMYFSCESSEIFNPRLNYGQLIMLLSICKPNNGKGLKYLLVMVTVNHGRLCLG